MDTTWVVAANAGRARIFADAPKASAFEEVNDMVNEAVRMRTAELETDRLGPTSAGKSIHNTGGATPNKTYEPAQTPAEHETERFARSIIGFLEQGHQRGEFAELALCASPQFLGVPRGLLKAPLKSLVSVELNKDYTHTDPVILREQIRAHRESK